LTSYTVDIDLYVCSRVGIVRRRYMWSRGSEKCIKSRDGTSARQVQEAGGVAKDIKQKR
jgi:hypothetical protein